jgi:hypothetical protein
VTAPTADYGKLTLAAVVKRCISRLKRDANHLKVDTKCYFDGLQTKHDNLQGKVFELKTAEAVRQIEGEELLDEAKKVCDEISRKRRTDTVNEIKEEARELKRRCEEI